MMTARKTADSKAVEKDAVNNETAPNEDVDLYNVNEGVHGRTGGPYLDDVQARAEEDRRALIEGREPNYDDLQPFVGVQLVNKQRLIDGYNSTLIAGDDERKFEKDAEIGAPVAATVPAEALEVPDETADDETDKPEVNSPAAGEDKKDYSFE